MWQTILANMLFNKDKFKLHGKNFHYTMNGEPITNAPGIVILNVTMKSGERRVLRLKENTLVSVQFQGAK